MIRAVGGWLTRRGLLYVAIAAAMTLAVMWQRGAIDPAFHQGQAAALERAIADLETARAQRQAALRAAADASQRKSIAGLRTELTAATGRRDTLRRRLAADRGGLAALLGMPLLDPVAILARKRLELELDAAEAEVTGLAKALAAAQAHGDGVAMATARLPAALAAERAAHADWKTAASNCAAATRTLQAAGWLRRLRERMTGELATARRDACAAASRRKQDHARTLASLNAAQAKVKSQRVRAWVADELPLRAGDLRARAAAEQRAASDTLGARVQRFSDDYGLPAVLKLAFGALLLAIAAPYMVRLLCWFVLAPVAARRPAVRLMAEGATVPPAERSAPSVAVRLAAGEELLVRQDHLRSSGATAALDTRWLLDPRRPFTCMATGLRFLTRVRGDGEVTTFAVEREPFVELAVVTLPAGAAMVLHPRALAAVAHPIAQPLRVEVRWRLGSLDGWLMLRLRHVLFHGPARLVVKGGRGVRVEPAERGRVFDPDQLIGASADLAWSVVRTRPLAPYLLGSERLLKARVEAGGGVLLIEEAPRVGARGDVGRRGIEGLADAGLKLFGL